MQTIKHISRLFILLFIITSCTEKIDIALDSSDTRLAVEGYLTSDTTTHWVRLTQSKDYYSSNPVTSVSNAVVKIIDGSQSITLTENPQKPGYYETVPDFFGKAGHSYQLDINLENEIGGQSHYTSNSTLNPVGTIDSIQVVYNDNWKVYEVQIFAWEAPSTDFYLFQVIKNGELITDTIGKWIVSDDRYFNGNYTNGISVGFLDAENPREDVHPGDTITLKMSVITKAYYEFIIELQDITYQFRNPLFSGPPSNVTGNIPNATGFFSTYSSTYSSTVYQ